MPLPLTLDDVKRLTARYRLMWIVFALSAVSLSAERAETRADEKPVESTAASESRFARVVVPFLKQHCTDCHSGEDAEADFSLDEYHESANIQTDYGAGNAFG